MKQYMIVPISLLIAAIIFGTLYLGVWRVSTRYSDCRAQDRSIIFCIWMAVD